MERRANLGLPPKDNLHITLWEFTVNLKNTDSQVFYDPRVIQIIKNSFDKNLRANFVNLTSLAKPPATGGIWDFFGIGSDIKRKYWVVY